MIGFLNVDYIALVMTYNIDTIKQLFITLSHYSIKNFWISIAIMGIPLNQSVSWPETSRFLVRLHRSGLKRTGPPWKSEGLRLRYFSAEISCWFLETTLQIINQIDSSDSQNPACYAVVLGFMCPSVWSLTWQHWHPMSSQETGACDSDPPGLAGGAEP